MELPICHPSGSFNIEAACRFLENLWTPCVLIYAVGVEAHFFSRDRLLSFSVPQYLVANIVRRE